LPLIFIQPLYEGPSRSPSQGSDPDDRARDGP
jgi:hypothetical protein